MPSSHQQVYLVNGILVDYFNNPLYLPALDGPTGPIGATGVNGINGVTGPTGSTAATSKFVKEWITAGNERITILASEIRRQTPGYLIGEIRQSLSDIQIQLWKFNSAFISPNESAGRPNFWQLINSTDYVVNVDGGTGDIYIDLTYRLVNSTRTRAVVIC